jgi:hypothetical protein
VLAALVALGLSGFLLRRPGAETNASDSEKLSRPAIALRAALALSCIALLGLCYAIGLFDPRYQGADDRGAYFLHAKMILETGTLYEPFSFRRIASYGGQPFLHALLMVVAPIEQVNLLDKGVCRVGVGLAVVAWALAAPRRSLWAALLASYVVSVYYDFATNTASLFSGVLAFAGLWMTLDLCRREPGRPVVNGILTGLAAAATLPLRQNYVLACVLVVLFEHAGRLRAGGRYDWRELPIAGGVAALGVGSWALLQLHSCGTALYPLLRGFANPEWSVLAAQNVDEYLNALRNFLGYRPSSAPVLLCGLVLCIPRRAPDEASLRLTAAAGLVAFAANSWFLAHAHPNEIARYTAAFLLPPVLFAAAHVAAILGRVRGATGLLDWRLWLCAPFLGALLAFLPFSTRLTGRLHWLGKELHGQIDSFPDDADTREAYERLQSAAPAGEKIVTMLDRPYLLDLRRNQIVSLDLPGGVSPPPGLFRIETPHEVVWYLRELGYSWLGATRPWESTELHEFSRWESHARGTRKGWLYDSSDVAAWQAFGRTIVRFYRQFDVIARSCRLAYDDGSLVMIDLSRCRFEGPRPTDWPDAK